MNKKISIIFVCLLLVFIGIVSSAVLISDQGTSVKNSTGSLLSTGNLSIEIYDNSTGGTIIVNQTFTDAIINGSWNLMLNASLEFGERYWKDYKINGEDIDFDGNERLEFQSPLGSKNLSIAYDYTTNGSLITWSNAANGTLAATNTANSFGNFNQSMNSTTFFLWALLNRVGIGTAVPQNPLNVIGAGNFTGDIFSREKNLSIGYDYAVNSTGGGSDTFAANYSNFTIVYAYALNDSRWTLNYSDYLTTRNYALNDSLWTSNYSNFTVTYGYAINSTGSSDSFIANFTNFTRIYANITDYNASWSSTTNSSYVTYANWNATNTSYLLGSNLTYAYALNDTLWSNNYSNFSIGWLYATNSTGGSDTFIANFTNFTRVYANVTDYNASWSSTTNTTYNTGSQYATNGTYYLNSNPSFFFNNLSNFSVNLTNAGFCVYNSTLDKLNCSYSVGGSDTFAANYSNFTTLYGNQLGNASNITTVYGYALNDSRWTLNYSNFSIGWLYATNSTGGSDSFIANFTNFTRIYANVTDYNASWSSITNTSYYLATNPFGFYNVTTLVEADPYWNANATNFTVTYGYAINTSDTDSFIANYTNFTRLYANVTDYNSSWSSTTNSSYLLGSNVTYAYALNDTLWSNNYSNFSIGWLYATNSTGGDSFIANFTNFTRIYANVTDYNASWSSTTNSSYVTYANWNATNTSYYLATNPFGFYNSTGSIYTTFNISNGNFTVNNQTTYNLFVVNGTNGKIGIGTNTSQTNLDIIGDANATGTIYAQKTKNLSIGYDYATNGSLSNTFTANYTNFTRIYANITDYNASWSSTTNTSYLLGTNVTYAYALNDSRWTLNYSNFTVTYGYAINGTDTDSFIANFTNFTRIYANVTDYNASWSSTTNTSYLLGSNVTYAYALNDTLWTANYSTYLTKPTYAQVVNGTDVALTTAANTFGNFNQTFNGSTFFVWALLNRTGIGTITPQNTLNVVGDSNFTTAAYVNNKNLEVGYDYAVNSTTDTDSFIANFTNFTRIYANVTDYNASWSSITNTSYYLATNPFGFFNSTNPQTETDPIWTANYTNFTTVYGYAINTTDTDSFIANFTNFTRIYANVTAYNTSWSSTTNTSYLLDSGDTGTGTYHFNISNGMFNITNSTGANLTFINGTTGRVGIGTAIPNETLGVGGAITLDRGGVVGSFLINHNSGDGSYFASHTNSTERSTGNLIAVKQMLNSYGDVIQTSPATSVGSARTWTSRFAVAGGQNSTVAGDVILGGSFDHTNPFYPGAVLVVKSTGNVGINTSTPQNMLNVMGVGNFTEDIFSRERNLSIGYDYALNSTDTDSFIANFTNFTRVYANVTDYNASWSSTTNTSYLLTTNTTYAYSLNDTLWTANYSTYLTKPTWAQVNNGTNVALVSAANSFGAFNQSFNTSNIYIWALLNRTGIGTITPQNTLNVVGDANFTTAAYVNNKNLEVGYDYAVNSTTDTDSFIANFTNFTRIYANVTDYNASWSSTTNSSYVTYANWNSTNTSYLLGSNVTYAYSLNNSLWTLNYSNFSIGWLYATNSTGGDSFIANFTNFTRIYANVTDYNASWSSTTNTSYLLGSNVTYAYALNDTLWTLNYSTFLTHITWATAYNGTLAKTDAANTFGNFNQTFNVSTFFIWALLNRTGIGTITPQNTLNVVGDANFTTAAYVDNKDLEVGYDYAVNSTGGADTFIANYTNFTRVYANVTDYNTSWSSTTNTSYLLATNTTYAYSLNNTFTSNVTATNNYITNGTGGAYIYHNGTGWVLRG